MKKPIVNRRPLYKGFTLLETLIVVAIFGMLFAMTFEILVRGRMLWDRATMEENLQSQVRRGMESMLRDLYRTNKGRLVNLSNTSIAFRIPVGMDSMGYMIWGADGIANHTITLVRNNQSQILRRVEDSVLNLVSEQVIANDVQALNFSQSGDLLTVSISVSRLNATSSNYSMSSEIYFRN